MDIYMRIKHGIEQQHSHAERQNVKYRRAAEILTFRDETDSAEHYRSRHKYHRQREEAFQHRLLPMQNKVHNYTNYQYHTECLILNKHAE